VSRKRLAGMGSCDSAFSVVSPRREGLLFVPRALNIFPVHPVTNAGDEALVRDAELISELGMTYLAAARRAVLLCATCSASPTRREFFLAGNSGNSATRRLGKERTRGFHMVPLFGPSRLQTAIRGLCGSIVE